MDDFSFLEAVDYFSQSIVIAVANAADRGLNPCSCHSFTLANGQMLRSPVAVMNQSHPFRRPLVMNRLLQGIKNKPGMGRGADPPADDLAGVGVNDESDVSEAPPSRDIN